MKSIVIVKGILIICFLIAQGAAYAENISPAFMPEAEDKELVYLDKKTGAERSRLNISLKKIPNNTSAIYKIASTGKGDYDKYQDVTWETDAEMEERQGLLYPLYSISIIKETAGHPGIKHEKRFDYEKQKIFYSVSDGQGDIIKKVTFPMKGLTADSATMMYVLKAFVAHRNDRAYREFYLLSDRGKLYRVTIKPIGKEILDLPSRKVEAIKLRLIPNLGLLTGVIGSLIPPTFVWYIDQAPYEWLQYQGLETGIGSTHIKTYLFNSK